MLSFLLAKANSFISPDERSFLSYMKQIGQYFVGEEYAFRYGVFLTNKRFIKEFNENEHHSFKIGITSLAHLTQAEYRCLLGAKMTKKPKNAKAFQEK